MSYDLAVWDGDRPADDAAAAAQFAELFDRFLEAEEPVDPTPRIAEYVTALLDRYPDADPDDGDGGPWSAGPVMNQARGPLVYLTMAWSRSDEVSAWAARLAGEHGLTCYDPQARQLRTPWSRPWRFELTSADGRSFRDPDAEVVRRVVSAVGAEDYFAILERSDDWYVQVGYGERAGTRPGWYALERREGAPDRHHRVEVANVGEVVQAFLGFLRDDPTIAGRFAWQPYTF